MTESHAIMRYLADSRGLADHWYPSGLKERAQVDEYLDQHHSFLRVGVAGYIFKKFFQKNFWNMSFEEEELVPEKIMYRRALRLIEERLTKHPYLCGKDISIADISAACELEQMRIVDFSLDNYPKTKEWLHRCVDENPIMNEVHKPVRKFAKMMVQRQKKAGTLPKL